MQLQGWYIQSEPRYSLYKGFFIVKCDILSGNRKKKNDKLNTESFKGKIHWN